MKNSKDRYLFRSLGYPLLITFALICLIPFITIISASFTSETYILKNGYSLFPKELTVDSYKVIFKNPISIFRAYGITIVVTICGTSLGVFLNTMAGYVLQRNDFEWRNLFSFYYFFTTLFSGGLVPWYILCTQYLHLKNNIFALYEGLYINQK